MNEQPYTSPLSAAENINVLIEHLKRCDDGEHLYRGQVQAYDAPLLPSIFRGVLDLSKTYGLNSREFEYSIRGLGDLFVGDYVQDLKNWVKTAGEDECTRYDQKETIRQRFYSSFGYLLGSAFLQQYGLKSEMLDATSDVEVAAFFATHQAPNYAFVDPGSLTPEAPKYGVIYRFERLDRDLDIHSIQEMDYYTAPGTLSFVEFLKQFEDDASLEESFDAVRSFFERRRILRERRFDLLRFPRGLVENSRVGRQKAAVIIPDHLRNERMVPGFDGIHVYAVDTTALQLNFLSVEDVRCRKGTTAYYFMHSDTLPEIPITAEYLWPNQEDALLKLVVCMLHARFSLFVDDPVPSIPRRLDFIDPGAGHMELREIRSLVEQFFADKDEYETTLRYMRTIPNIDERLEYYAEKAAQLCYHGHVTTNFEYLRAAMQLCEKALETDTESNSLQMLKAILHYAMGEPFACQAAMEKVLMSCHSQEMEEAVRRRMEGLLITRYSPRFVSLFKDWFDVS